MTTRRRLLDECDLLVAQIDRRLKNYNLDDECRDGVTDLITQAFRRKISTGAPHDMSAAHYQGWLNTQAYNCLRGEDLETAEEAACYTVTELLRVPNLGVRNLARIERWLAACGLALAEDEE